MSNRSFLSRALWKQRQELLESALFRHMTFEGPLPSQTMNGLRQVLLAGGAPAQSTLQLALPSLLSCNQSRFMSSLHSPLSCREFLPAWPTISLPNIWDFCHAVIAFRYILPSIHGSKHFAGLGYPHGLFVGTVVGLPNKRISGKLLWTILETKNNFPLLNMM